MCNHSIIGQLLSCVIFYSHQYKELVTFLSFLPWMSCFLTWYQSLSDIHLKGYFPLHLLEKIKFSHFLSFSYFIFLRFLFFFSWFGFLLHFIFFLDRFLLFCSRMFLIPNSRLCVFNFLLL